MFKGATNGGDGVRTRMQFSTSTRFSLALTVSPLVQRDSPSVYIGVGTQNASAFPWNNCHRPRECSAARFPESGAISARISQPPPFGANKTREESSIGNCRVAVKALNAVAERFTREIERDAKSLRSRAANYFSLSFSSNSSLSADSSLSNDIYLDRR